MSRVYSAALTTRFNKKQGDIIFTSLVGDEDELAVGALVGDVVPVVSTLKNLLDTGPS